MKKIYFLITLCILFLCSCDKDEETNTNHIPINTTIEFDENSVKQELLAEEICLFVSNLDGIESSTVKVIGDTAIIGIKPYETLDDETIMKYKTEIVSNVKNNFPQIERTSVTLSNELINDISNLENSVSISSENPQYDENIEKLVINLTPPV